MTNFFAGTYTVGVGLQSPSEDIPVPPQRAAYSFDIHTYVNRHVATVLYLNHFEIGLLMTLPSKACVGYPGKWFSCFTTVAVKTLRQV